MTVRLFLPRGARGLAAQRVARTLICGRLDRPGIELDNAAEVDYSGRETSVDQARIEAVLRETPLGGKTLLHVGVGNSGLACRLAGRLRWIDGLTVHPNEVARAAARGVANYRAYLLNKHGRNLVNLPNEYDVIVDNNLASFACCAHHFHLMLDNFAAKLKPGGRILTDERGMAWTADGNKEWKLTYEDLAALRASFPLRASRVTGTVYALEKVG